MMLNGSALGCGLSCNLLNELPNVLPPPDAILWMPPPPVPPFLQKSLVDSLDSGFERNDDCNFCHLFRDPSGEGAEFTVPKPDVKSDDSWLSLLVASILGSTIFGALLVVFLIKCKKWKIFPVSDSCPILPESFLGGHKSAPPPCSPTDSCISPVVNEKSPQSVITSSTKKGSSISSKYWRRGNDLSQNRNRQILDEGHILDRRRTGLDDYSGDTASCTSSPVYAELDVAGVNNIHDPTPILISGPSESISPYAVHTYSEVPEALRMAALGSSSVLLPDASHRAATLAQQMGSAVPLLASHHRNGTSHLNYLTGGRPLKKPRPLNAHHMQRSHHNIARAHEELEASQPAYGQRRRHGGGLYADLPNYSHNFTTFRAANFPYNLRDSKRPLPPVPGVHL